MDPKSSSCSFLKLVDVHHPTKVEIPYDFATLLWGEQFPYGDRVKIFAADNLWIVEKYGLGPVLGDGFVKVVTDSGLQKNDYMLFNSLGPSTWYLDVFKSCLMANKFWGQFYGSSYKGGSATLYVGDRFWHVKMEAFSDKCAFTDGWSKLIRDLALDSRTTFIFTMAGYETFELSVFNHESGTQMYFKKVDVVVLDDPIYGDDGFDLLLASEHKEKVITNECDVDEDVGGDIVGGSMRLSSSSDAYRSHNDPKGKSKIVFGQESVSPKVHPKVKSKFYVGDKGFPTKEITPAEDKQAKPKCKAFRSTTSTALHVGRKCSTSKKFKKTDVIEFTKKAESRLRLPTDVSSHLCLSLDNLHHVTVQNEKCELLKLGTRREKSGKGFKYGFKKWPAFLKLNYIDFGSTLFFTYVKSSQRLMLTKVVPKITNKRCRS
ncbi:putative transcription factor B3-Domain family [Helianthus annuus]|uniref:Transcription factor B3-Domain family n=1 Tax=Helianthus annuus TaxID=4232 RepID=A0A9K3HBM1_HELAN|nr:putative transcription factor B3-Domain family [Helianthus annuus]